MQEWIVDIVRQLGPFGIGLLMLLENVLPPIPSEIIMPLAGFLSENGGTPFWTAVGAGVTGATVGALGWYALARRIGRDRLMGFADGRGRWIGIDRDGLERAHAWFTRHSGRAVFFGRLVPGLRTFISVPAGFTAMPFTTFLLYTFTGTAIWSAALAFAGLLLGRRFEVVEQYIGIVSWVVVGAALLMWVWRIVRLWRRAAD